jgi:protein-tyrosine phosphatase
MAEVALGDLVAGDGVLRDRVQVSSAGTANWHVGKPMDPRARRALDRAGINRPAQSAAYADRGYLDHQDLVVVMTREHLNDVRGRLTNQTTEVIMLRNLLSPGLDLDVADPYYGDDREFDECLELLRECCRRLTLEFRQRLDAGSLEA